MSHTTPRSERVRRKLRFTRILVRWFHPLARWIRAMSDSLNGFDYFISYAHDDGQAYPRELKRQLKKARFRVFLDQEIYTAGDELDEETRRRIRMSTRVIVLARPHAMDSKWVRREIEDSIRADRRIIAIDINETLDRYPPDHPTQALLADRLHLSDSMIADTTGPSESVLTEIQRSFDATRRERWRQAVITTVASTMAIVAGIAVWFYLGEGEATRAALVRLAHARISEANRHANSERHATADSLFADARRILVEASGDALPIDFAESGYASTWHRPIRTILDQGDPVQSVAFSRDRRLVAAAAYGKITIWRVRDGEPVHDYEFPNKGWVTALGFTIGDQELIVCGPRLVEAVAVGSWQQRVVHEHDQDSPNYMLSPDTRRVMIPSRTHLVEVDAATGEVLWDCPTNLAWGMPESPYVFSATRVDEAKVAAVAVGAIGLIDAGSNKLEHRIQNTEIRDYNYELSISPDRSKAAFVCGMTDNALQFWSFPDFAPFNASVSIDSSCSAHRFTPDSKAVLVGSTIEFPHAWGSLRLWYLYPTGRPLMSMYGASTGITAIDISRDGDLAVSGSKNGCVELWTLREQIGAQLAGANNALERITLSDSGRLALGTSAKMASLWHTTTGHKIKDLATAPLQHNHQIALAPSGRIAVVNDGLSAALEVHELAGDDEPVVHPTPGRALELKMLSDNLCSGLFYGKGTRFAVLNIRTGEVRFEVGVNSEMTRASTFATDSAGSRAFIGYYKGHVRCWSPDGTSAWEAEVSASAVECMAIAADDHTLAIGAKDGSIAILDADGSVQRRCLDHQYEIQGLRFDPTGRLLFSIDKRGLVVVWEVGSGRSIARVPSPENFIISVESCAVSASNRMIVVQHKPGVNSAHNYFAWDIDRYVEMRRVRQDLDASPNQPSDLATSLHLRGRWYALRGMWAEALHELTEARDKGVDIDTIMMARCLVSSGRDTEALAELQRVGLSRKDKDPFASKLWAESLERKD